MRLRRFVTMWILLVIVAVLVGILAFLLLSPIRILVDSDSLTPVSLHWWGVMRLSLFFDGEKLRLELRMFGFRRLIPFKKRKKKEKPKKKRKWNMSLSKVRGLLRSFEVEELWWALDTGNFALNAQLMGLTWLLQGPHTSVTVNFQGENHFRMRIKNTLGRLGWAFLKK